VTLVGGATVLTIEYRIFQGPDTGQLVLIWIWAFGCIAVGFGAPALLLGLTIGAAAGNLSQSGWREAPLLLLGGSAHVALYSLVAWLAARQGLGADLFELRWQIIPVAALTGIIAGPIAVHGALNAARRATVAAG